jgi:hypothetical protein
MTLELSYVFERRLHISHFIEWSISNDCYIIASLPQYNIFDRF